jgi:carbon storage regulator
MADGGRVLVVTRRVDEAVVIGDGIEVRVLRVGRSGVRLGITAAAGVPVHRREVYDVVSASNRAAATDEATVLAWRERLALVRPDPV